MNQASQLCYAALLKNFAYYSQIMLIDIEQFPEFTPRFPFIACKFTLL